MHNSGEHKLTKCPSGGKYGSLSAEGKGLEETATHGNFTCILALLPWQQAIK
jgi:hypothetical protein